MLKHDLKKNYLSSLLSVELIYNQRYAPSCSFKRRKTALYLRANLMYCRAANNWTAFGEIQTSTTTFIACLTHFRLISHPFKNPIESPQAHGDTSQSPYPCPRESPWESPYQLQPCFTYMPYLSALGMSSK